MAEYVEREAFMHFLVKQHCENCDKRKGMKNGKECFVYEIGDAPCRSCGIDDALDYVEYFPSADVQPVVHGKWKQEGGKYSRHKTIDRRILTCSVCGNFLCMDGVNSGRGDANYCPNCGADMRGE